MDSDWQLPDRIVELVGQCWQEKHSPMLLSALGTIDRQIAPEARRQSGGLRAYIEASLDDRVRVVQHGTKPTVIGAVPRNQETDDVGDWDALLDELVGAQAERRLADRRFHRAFWAAFRQPLDESRERCVAMDGPVRFSDEPTGHQPYHTIEVQRELIVGQEASISDVHQSIGTWLTANNLEPTRFLETARSDTLPSNDVLGKLILALSLEELDQISIPMPIVAKLRRQPV